MTSVTSQNFNMASKNEIFQAADLLLECFKQSKDRLDVMSPADQYSQINTDNEAYEGGKLIEISKILTGLQKRVSATSKQEWGFIPDTSNEELQSLSDKLRKSATLLDSIRNNCVLAKDICDLYATHGRIFTGDTDRSNIDLKTKQLLQKRITQLKSQFSDTINLGNKTVFEQMEAIAMGTTRVGRVNPARVLLKDEQFNFLSIDRDTQKIINQIKTIGASTKISPERKEEIFKSIRALLDTVLIESPTLSSQTVEAEKKIDAIKDLQGLLPLFQESTSPQNLELALANLAKLESKNIKLSFKISGDIPVNVVDRPCLHLYFIHKKESPEKIEKFKNDLNYGEHAMKGVYLTSKTERHRAILRTIAELGLQQLEDAVGSNRIDDVYLALNTLEGLKMSPSDMPPGQHNLVHILFGQMYNKHVEARKSNPLLVNPNDRKFQRDFGRNAFSVTEGIDTAVKIAAINALRQALKDIWQIP